MKSLVCILSSMTSIAIPCLALLGTTVWGQDDSAANRGPQSAALSEAPGKEFVYKQSGGKERVMEIYFPKEHDPTAKRVPAILMFHGGGWSGGSLQQFRAACQYFASRGIVAATANYRMLDKREVAKQDRSTSKKRVCVTDAKSAIRWMKQNAEKLGIDPEKLVLGGGSAGGHLCVLATTNPSLDDPNDPIEISTRVTGYVLFNPAFADEDSVDPEIDGRVHIGAVRAPAVVFYGTDDPWKKGWDEVEAKWRKVEGSPLHVFLAPKQPHGFFNRGAWQIATLREADAFLVSLGILRGEPTLAPAESVKLERIPNQSE
ncbi:Carboxylesterase NlhH [Pirellula sp. SH-Sr6A]|uniref:alpha/beta hydrolase n=1 Tax=Pirellula sp. SH-Sr6A TaxID=1632865 RepID=UPI00078C7664|nr:alpha/beta hydrolase [Pirellula sp. SH-Sr6A]AMV32418.1 Carboxylesterase NlhH [Pirellula sp. SH-Sr6A]